ncbi:hypothetical protein [Nocardia brasiliensis]
MVWKRLVGDFGADVALLGSEPDRVGGWFGFVRIGDRAAEANPVLL